MSIFISDIPLSLHQIFVSLPPVIIEKMQRLLYILLLFIVLFFTASALSVDASSLTVSRAFMCADKGVLEISYAYVSPNPAQKASIRFPAGPFSDTSGIVLSADSGVIYLPLVKPSSDSTDYPRPDTYPAVLTIYGSDSSSVSSEFKFSILYPSWIIHQKWNDVLMVMNEKYNGGYVFTAFQWYKDGVRLDGEKNEYLYLPEHLDTGSEYYVELTREDDNKTICTCAMVPEKRDDGYAEYVNPYITVYPTIVRRSEPIVTVNTNSKGEYWIYTPAGQLIDYNTYDAGADESFQLRLPYISNVYFIKFKTDANTSKTERIIVD